MNFSEEERQKEWTKVRSATTEKLTNKSENLDYRPLHEKLNEQRMLEEQELRERAKLSKHGLLRASPF